MSVSFNFGLLQVARQARGFSQVDLARAAGVTQGYLSKLENGVIDDPTDEVVDRLSSALKFPSSLFRQNDPVFGLPVSVHPMYRRKASVGQKELDRLQAELNLRLLHFRRLLKSVDFEGELPLPELSVDEFGDPEKIAELVRRTWLLPKGPIQNLVACLERAGCLVVFLDLPGVAIDGVTLNAPGTPPCVFINRQQPADRMRFTLAHELGHIVMHRIPSARMEEEANAFASALLMPARDLLPYVGGHLTIERLAALKPVWRVSMQALLYRARSIHAITANQSQYLWRQISRLGLRTREPPELDFSPEEPKVVPQLLRVHLEQLGYTLADLSTALHVHADELQRMYGLPHTAPKPPYLHVVSR